MANAETFGARLKRIRKIKGLSQKELAKNSGVSQQMICQYESSYKLKTGHTKSCGCYRNEAIGNCKSTHGQRHTRLYREWCAMKYRCVSKNEKIKKSYSDKGISVCQEWQRFEPFMEWALSNGYSDNLTLDRKDNDKGYSPENCRWATVEKQANNKGNNHYLEYNGKTYTMSELAKECGINYSTLRSRLNRDKMPVELAVRRA